MRQFKFFQKPGNWYDAVNLDELVIDIIRHTVPRKDFEIGQSYNYGVNKSIAIESVISIDNPLDQRIHISYTHDHNGDRELLNMDVSTSVFANMDMERELIFEEPRQW